MCLRALVVTLALIWTISSSLSVSAFIEVSDIPKGTMDLRRKQYNSEPIKVGTVVLSTIEQTSRKQLQVQIWKQIPNWVAYALTLERENNPVKIIGTETPVPVIVTGYFGGQQKPYPVEDCAWTPHTSGSWPELHVAAWEPQGWDMGTAVWTHILLALEPYRGTDAFLDLVLEIAYANPKFSHMLYQKLDLDGRPLGEFRHGHFQLLSKTQKKAVISSFEPLLRVIPHTPKSLMYQRRGRIWSVEGGHLQTFE